VVSHQGRMGHDFLAIDPTEPGPGWPNLHREARQGRKQSNESNGFATASTRPLRFMLAGIQVWRCGRPISGRDRVSLGYLARKSNDGAHRNALRVGLPTRS
jgi:hypothetical protein